MQPARVYRGLEIRREEDGVVVVTIVGRDKVNSLDAQDHAELADVWKHLSEEDEARVIVVTGRGSAFCAGGNAAMEKDAAGNHAAIYRLFKEARDLVFNMIDCDLPIVSAINGPAAGAGLAVALLADVSIIGDDVVLTDGHTNIGIAAGDHAAMIWPLLCGMARAKYLLLTSHRVNGQYAADVGLVSRAVPREDVLSEAMTIARHMAVGPQQALRWTKRSLNNWLRLAGPTFESSLAMEMLGLFGPDFREGIEAFIEKRPAEFRRDAS